MPGSHLYNNTDLEYAYGLTLDFLTVEGTFNRGIDTVLNPIIHGLSKLVQGTIGDMFDFEFGLGKFDYDFRLGQLLFDSRNGNVGPLMRVDGRVEAFSVDLFENWFDLPLDTPTFAGIVGTVEDAIA